MTIIETFTMLNNRMAIQCKRYRYCPKCHVFHDDIWPPARDWWVNHPEDK